MWRISIAGAAAFMLSFSIYVIPFPTVALVVQLLRGLLLYFFFFIRKLRFYKESTFCLYRLFGFSQCGIPHRSCRFYWFLAGAYKESTLFFGFYSGFTRGEYHVIRVDFIVALRRTRGQRRWTLRSPSPPSSGLHLLTPGDPLRRGISAAAGLRQYRYLYSGASRLSPVPNMVLLSVFGLWSFAFQLGCPACIARFSLLGEGSFVCAATSCFAMVFRRICANRDWIVCFVW